MNLENIELEADKLFDAICDTLDRDLTQKLILLMNLKYELGKAAVYNENGWDYEE